MEDEHDDDFISAFIASINQRVEEEFKYKFITLFVSENVFDGRLLLNTQFVDGVRQSVDGRRR